MMKRIRQYRPTDELTREHRLCYETGPDPVKVKVDPGFIDKGKAFISDTVNLRWVRAGMDGVANVSSSWVKGIQEAWLRDTRIEELKDAQLRTIAAFTRTMPAIIQRIIEERFRAGERPTLEELAVILDHGKWLEFFKNPNNFFERTSPKSDAPSTIRNGVVGIVASLDELHRRRLYQDYVGAIIPRAVREDPNFAAVFGPMHELDPMGNVVPVHSDEKGSEMIKHTGELDSAMRMILGIQKPVADPANPVFNIAQQSLMHHYWRDGKREVDGAKLPFAELAHSSGIGGVMHLRGEGLKNQFMDDMIRASRGELFAGRMDDIAARLGPSFLKGALDPAMGVVEPEDVHEILRRVARKRTDDVAHLLNQDANVIKHTKVDKIERSRNAETLYETFMGMNMFEKIALAAIAFGALSSKKWRPILSGLGILYFAQRFIMKEEDPINKKWVPAMQAIAKKADKGTRSAFAYFNLPYPNSDKENYTEKELLGRTELVQDFLSKNAKTELNNAVAGITLIGDLPMYKLAKYLHISPDGTHAVIRVWDPEFQKDMKAIMHNRGASRDAAEAFFRSGEHLSVFDIESDKELWKQLGFDVNRTGEIGGDRVTKNILEAGFAGTVLFYMRAVKEPEHKRSLRLIEKFRGDNSFGPYDMLPLGYHEVELDGTVEKVNLRELYVYLVRQGELLSNGDETTIYEFIQNEMKSSSEPLELAMAEPPKPAAAPTGSAAVGPPDPIAPGLPAPSVGSPLTGPSPATSPIGPSGSVASVAPSSTSSTAPAAAASSAPSSTASVAGSSYPSSAPSSASAVAPSSAPASAPSPAYPSVAPSSRSSIAAPSVASTAPIATTGNAPSSVPGSTSSSAPSIAPDANASSAPSAVPSNASSAAASSVSSSNPADAPSAVAPAGPSASANNASSSLSSEAPGSSAERAPSSSAPGSPSSASGNAPSSSSERAPSSEAGRTSLNVSGVSPSRNTGNAPSVEAGRTSPNTSGTSPSANSPNAPSTRGTEAPASNSGSAPQTRSPDAPPSDAGRAPNTGSPEAPSSERGTAPSTRGSASPEVSSPPAPSATGNRAPATSAPKAAEAPKLHPQDEKLQRILTGGLNGGEAKTLLTDQEFKKYLAGLPIPAQQQRLSDIMKADGSGGLKAKLEKASGWYVYEKDRWTLGFGGTVNGELQKSGLSEKEGKLLVRRYVELKNAGKI